MKKDNPLYKFHFCPICGSPHFKEIGETARKCSDCQFTYYTNPRGATAAFIVNENGEMLVGRRAKEPAKGTLDLVGGFIDLDETAEHAICREILEESGLVVEERQLRYLFSQYNTYPFSGISVKTIDLFFEVTIKGRPLPKGMDDIESLRWIKVEELCPEDFGLNSIRLGVERWMKTRQES